jgi:hypothetical protein
MTRTGRISVLVAVVLTATALEWASAAAVAAQSWGWRPDRPPYASRRVRCESGYDRSTYCPTGTYGRVRLERRLGPGACREHITWGADADGGGIWVAGGCRAIFVVTPWGGPGYGPGYPPGYRPLTTISCKSKGFKPNWCRLPHGGRVRLERRLSDSPCIEYRTWGVDGGGIWVDRGCAGVFSIR